MSHIDSVHEVNFLPQTVGIDVICAGLVRGDSASQANNLIIKIQDNTGDGIYDKTFTPSGAFAAGLSLGT